MRISQDTQGTVNNEFTTNVHSYTNTGTINLEHNTTNLFRNSDRDEINNFINIDDELQEGNGMIRALLWNSSGLSGNLDRLVAQLKIEDIHFAVVCETWFHPDKHIPEICTVNSLSQGVPNLYRGTNGVSIVVNPEHIDNVHVKNMFCTAKDTVHGCFLSVQVAGVKLVGIYNAPSHHMQLEPLLNEIMESSRIHLNEPLIVAGDFNARLIEWRDTANNTAGRELSEWIESWNLERSDTGSEPTCSTARGRSIVDHVISNIPELTAKIIRRPVPLADHAPILFKFFPRVSTYSSRERTFMRIKKENLRDKDVRTFYGLECRRKNTTLLNYVEELESNLRIAQNNNDRQQAIDRSDKDICAFFLNMGKEILGETCAGKRKITYKPLSSETLDRLYTLQEQQPSINTASKIAKELCRLKRLRFEEFADSLSKKPAADVLKVISQINSNRKNRFSALNDTQEALAEYASYFSKLTTNTYPEPAERILAIILEPNEEAGILLADKIFRASIIFGILLDVPWNKAAGKSGVSYDLLKAADFSTLSVISKWFQIIFRTGLVPLSWTRSLLVPVPKKGDLNLISNYRPISLTESFRKIFEHCLVRFLSVCAGPMHFCQGGFRADHCCNDMILTLNEVLRKNKNMHVAFLDIKAAYDSVDRKILWNRCRDRGFGDEVIRILQRLFDHNSSQVVVNGRRSEPFGIKAGLLQGSVLSPFLYSIFIDSLAEELSNHASISIGTCRINCTMYADDIAVFAKSAQVLQMLLIHCGRHANLNRYRFNVAKCSVIGNDDYDYKLAGNSIPKVNTFIYLGVEFGSSGLKLKEFVERRCKTAVDAGMKLVGMGMNLGGFAPSVASMLYKVFIRSKLEANSCLIPKNSSLTKKLEAAQRKILARFFFCGPNSSGTIVRSLMNAPSMEFRQKFLRSRYVHRSNELETNHVLRRTMLSTKSYMKKLAKDIFDKDQCTNSGRERLKIDEMKKVHAATAVSTAGHLIIEADGKIPWFLRKRMDPMLRKRICHWVLKKYPASAPKRCGRCNREKCSQEHVAECSNLLESITHNIPARFRPESMLSNPESNVNLIGAAILTSVRQCLPHLNL